MTSKQNKQSQQPIASGTQDQAPIIPFAPYQFDPEYEPPYSTSLMEKSNKLAASIWANKEAYDLMRPNHVSTLMNKELREVVEKNQTVFDRMSLDLAIRNTFDNFGFGYDTSYSGRQKINNLIKKLKRLERKFDSEEIMDYEKRERLIDMVLFPGFPSDVFNSSFGQQYVDFRWPPMKAVVNELLTAEEVNSMETVFNFIPRIRNVMKNYKPYADGYEKERLLQPFGKTSSIDNRQRYFEKDLLQGIKYLHNFVSNSMPFRVMQDHVPALRHPVQSTMLYSDVQKASQQLREAVLGYVQEQNTLSDMMENILNLADSMRNYFLALVNEINDCFLYFNHIGLSFEKLVEESETRIEQSQVPF